MDLVPLKKHGLTPAQFEQLADVPPEEEWLANITNLKTRRAYKGRCTGVYRVYRFAGLHEATFRRPVAYYFLAQGHGKTRSGAGHHSAQALGAVLALRLSLRTQRCHRQSGGRSETANGQRERRQHAAARRRAGPQLLEAPPADTLKGGRDR